MGFSVPLVNFELLTRPMSLGSDGVTEGSQGAVELLPRSQVLLGCESWAVVFICAS